jgi:ABC-type uncharacterized transport system substrate-binding protein
MYRDLKVRRKVSVRKTYINIITIAATPTFRALRSRTSEDNRPEANVTGASIASGPLAQKRLELILEMIPHATVIGYLENQGLASFELYTRNIATAAQSKGREVVPFGASTSRKSIRLTRPRSSTLSARGGPGPSCRRRPSTFWRVAPTARSR